MSLLGVLLSTLAVAGSPVVELQRDDQASQLKVRIDDREILVYQYAAKYALPHYWPLRSPSGRLLTVQHPDPYPHHRSLWIADKLQGPVGPPVDFYHCWKNYRTPIDPNSGFRHFIRHEGFGAMNSAGNHATFEAKLRWIVDDTQPVLDEHREIRIVALGQGECRLDLAWELKAEFGDVKILSDKVHYAWPFVRMHPQFRGEQGGTITSDGGHKGQSETDGKVAKWIDYSNTIEGVTEGLAIFLPDAEPPRKWLTREYGTFGPRRVDRLSGTQFTLKSGDSLRGRAGILIHRGDAASGRVAERYQQYVESNP